jgi:heme A synthase
MPSAIFRSLDWFESGEPKERASFATAASRVLAFTILVVLFGAVVRITGSGAGCGQHWPTCQGDVLLLPKRLETAIELTHRVTSGLSALLVFWLTRRAFVVFERGHKVRWATGFASLLMIVEALIGAVLVRLMLVGDNASAGRAVIMPLHLITTSGLLAFLGLSVWWSRSRVSSVAADPKLARIAAFAGLLLLVVSGLGAITALGDTLYPVSPEAAAVTLSFDHPPEAHFLERLRVLHPVVALFASGVLIWLATRATEARHSRGSRLFSRSVLGLTVAQGGVGGLNVILSAPGWLQVLHLLLANLLWLSLVLLGAELAQPLSEP